MNCGLRKTCIKLLIVALAFYEVLKVVKVLEKKG